MKYNIVDIESRWGLKLRALKKLGLLPQRWTNAKLLAGFLLRIDIMFLYSTPIKVHKVLGKHLECTNPTAEEKIWRETPKDVLLLKTARRFMLDESWGQICADMTAEYGNEKERIGNKSIIGLEDLIDERDLGAIKIGLAFSGKYIPTVKHKKDKTEEARAERLNELAKAAQQAKKYDGKDVKNLKGDN